MKVAQNIRELIGNTPLLKLNSVSQNAAIYGKCEFFNPTHSVKDRIAFGMIEKAIEDGLVTKSSIIIEPTSGNTGIGLAMVCASMGLSLTLTMPSSMSIERRRLLQALGAKIVLTPPELGMQGAVDEAIKLAKSTKNSFIPQQFNNISNPKTHEKNTAKEIIEALGSLNEKVDILVAAVGTGGTLTGIGRALLKHNPNIYIVAVEPNKSAVLSGEKPGPHKIQGIGAGFIPKVLDKSIYNEIVQVSYEDAVATSRELAKKEGILVGISSGANVWASKLMADKFKGKNIVTILCDTGERYLSTDLYE